MSATKIICQDVDTSFLSNIIYAEYGTDNPSHDKVILVTIENDEVQYKYCKQSEDEELSSQLIKFLQDNIKFKNIEIPYIFLSDDDKIHRTEHLFDYFYGGMGNQVFFNKNIDIQTKSDHFECVLKNKKYQIFTSVIGIFESVCIEMKE